MQSILSLLSGAVLVVVVYGLSYFPSATLAQGNEVEEVGDLNKEGIDPDAGCGGRCCWRRYPDDVNPLGWRL
jgi:hypothetical protein